MEFMLGCNYWASNAGTEMWRMWDPKAVDEDLRVLSEHGVTHLRVFPNWRDFQPVMPVYTSGGDLMEYRTENDEAPENKYFLSETMLERFSDFCKICDKYNLKLIVGLLTGWMSGRLFIPSALFGRNLFTDPVALLFEQKFIEGFVKYFKDYDAIYAWDLGNECNCLSKANNRFEAATWTATISNAIRANDNTRPVISGMHGMKMPTGVWTMTDQGDYTDMLTTHPYPYFVPHANKEEITSFRTSMHATCETKYYSDISKKPCLVEEIGTLGPMVCSDEIAADFLRCNMFSNFIYGSPGVLWWCANDQTNLDTIPYTRRMVEVELGMMTVDRQPKPVLKEMKKFSEFLKQTKLELDKPKDDAVCILTNSQDHWGTAYMSYCLAKQNDISLKFAWADDEIPESDDYMLPCINSSIVITAENYRIIRKRVQDGATLYISKDTGTLSEFNSLTGLKVIDSAYTNESGTVKLDGENIAFSRSKYHRVAANGAEVLAYDDKNEPAITVYKYGKGKVYYVNFPLETMLLNEYRAFDTNRYLIYKKIFGDIIDAKKVTSQNKYVTVTEHNSKGKRYCVAINHSDKEQATMFKFNGCKNTNIIYGNIDKLPPFDAVIFEIE